jgi:cytochrome c oxidase subunit 2
MRGKVVVDDAPTYQAWLERQATYAQLRNHAPGNVVAGQALFATCAACHGAHAEGNIALNAPKLTGQSAWYLERELKLFKQGARGTHEKDVYGKMMAPMAATLADDAAIQNVVAYIASLPDTPAAPTIQGNVRVGMERFETCSTCHGAGGRGIAATNAPRLAGMSDWYMARQLHNFRDGVRGAHPQDAYGPQMALVAGMLRDDAEIGDILAYINSR